MKVGIVSDIHCNLQGLEQALRLMGDVDVLLCPGDAVSGHRFSNEVVALLRERDAQVVLGNHEHEYLKHLAGAESQRQVADDGLVSWLGSHPERLELDLCGKRLLMVHSTPWTHDYVFPDSRDMQRFAEVNADFVLGGHTHSSFTARIGRALVVNPGSAGHESYGYYGNGYQRSEGPTLSCAVLDVVSEEVEIFRYGGRM